MNQVTIINLLISIAILICFFYLCSNVSAIKKQINSHKTGFENSMNLYLKHLSFGNKIEAKKHLEDYIWSLLQENNQYSTSYSQEDRQQKLAILKDRYEFLFKEIGSEFPKVLNSSTFEVFKNDI